MATIFVGRPFYHSDRSAKHHALPVSTYNFFSRRDKNLTHLDPELQRLIHSIIAQPENFLEYMYRDGILFKGGKIMLSSDSKLKACI